MIYSRTLIALDGPAAFTRKKVRKSGSTADNIRLEDGTWIDYDRLGREMYIVGWKETGIFVSGKEGIMFGVTEVLRKSFRGVL